MRLLIANRGEIAVRIARTALRMGLEPVMVYAPADRDALHAGAGAEAVPVEDYLRADLLVDAARRAGADAVHPGYGFLSENADFARLVVAAGLVWVGPAAAVIDAMGSKHEARERALSAGVPVLPGLVVEEDFQPDAAEGVGFPLMVKASRGGGGMGLRVVRDQHALVGALGEARQQAQRAFGDGALILERYVERPRHVEVQIVADQHGTVQALGDRDCSVQRRHQKLIEEAPAPNVPPGTRAALHDAAVALAREIGYDSVGTAEFLLDSATGEFFFLEMNTRLQVEHTVTEAVFGVDLVELQVRAARGERLAPLLERAVPSGHALEARVTAEDAWAGYLPSSGHIAHYRPPTDVRVDSGVAEGTVVTSLYDSLLLKVIAHAATRAEALARLDGALRELDLHGVSTPLDHLVAALSSPPYRAGRPTTGLLSEDHAQPLVPDDALVAAATWLAMEPRALHGVGPWARLGEWRLGAAAPVRSWVLAPGSGERRIVRLQEHGPGWRAGLDEGPLDYDVLVDQGGVVRVATGDHVLGYRCRHHAAQVVVHRPGLRLTLHVVPPVERTGPVSGSAADHDGVVCAPFPATVVEVYARPGDAVSGGGVVVVVEAMKMLHSLTAPFDGVIGEVSARAGDTVQTQQPLVTVRREAP